MTDWNRILNHPLFNMGFFLIVRQLTKSMDLENSDYIGLIRSLYLGSQFIIILLSFYLMSVIKNKHDMTVLRYVEPGVQKWDGTESSEKLITTTHMEYDIEDVKKQLKQSFTGLAIVSFLHLKFGYIQPLLIQSILGFKTFFMTKESKIHFFGGRTSTGELKRPFRLDAPFGFGMVNEKRQPMTDKRSIKRAEKAEKVL